MTLKGYKLSRKIEKERKESERERETHAEQKRRVKHGKSISYSIECSKNVFYTFGKSHKYTFRIRWLPSILVRQTINKMNGRTKRKSYHSEDGRAPVLPYEWSAFYAINLCSYDMYLLKWRFNYFQYIVTPAIQYCNIHFNALTIHVRSTFLCSSVDFHFFFFLFSCKFDVYQCLLRLSITRKYTKIPSAYGWLLTKSKQNTKWFVCIVQNMNIGLYCHGIAMHSSSTWQYFSGVMNKKAYDKF